MKQPGYWGLDLRKGPEPKENRFSMWVLPEGEKWIRLEVRAPATSDFEKDMDELRTKMRIKLMELGITPDMDPLDAGQMRQLEVL